MGRQGEAVEVVQKHASQEGGGVGARVGHAGGVEGVGFGFEEAGEQGEEDLGEDGDPFCGFRLGFCS